MKNYHHLFFDLDHTLWDYDRNSAATLSQLYEEYNLKEKCDFDPEEFIQCFSETNELLWEQFHEGTIDQTHIRSRRFVNIFEKLNSQFDFTHDISERYIRRCPTMGYLLPGAIELLEHLNERYELHIITNGFKHVQHIKLNTTGLDKFFDQVIISGDTGYRKPQPEIFEYALKSAKAQSECSIMIGDSIESDIVGAKNANMDQVLFNPKKKKHELTVTYEIESLLELKGLGF